MNIEEAMDNIVHSIMQDCASLNPPLDENEITRHVVQHFSLEMPQLVSSSLSRLVARGVLRDAHEHDHAHRYWLPPQGGDNVSGNEAR